MTIGFEAGDKERLLAGEQAALRRIATLVAAGAGAGEVFASVAQAVQHVLQVPAVMLARYEQETEPVIVVLASLNEPSFTPGSRWPLDGPSVSAQVLETERPARIDDYSELPGSIPAGVRDSGSGSTVGVAITVDGAVWGVLTVSARSDDVLAADTEARLTEFGELVGTAISNAADRHRLQGLAGEQAALRRIATLIAEGTSLSRLGTIVLEEAGRVLDVPAGWLVRYEPDDTLTIVASLNDPTFPPGSSWPLDGDSVSSRIRDAHRSARIDDYTGLPGTLSHATRASGIGSVAGAPVAVDGSVWGALCVGERGSQQLLPADAEARLRDFTELVATAISNAQVHDDLRKLADEQAALRRIATLVAEGTESSVVFDAVCAEAGRLIQAASVNLSRYTPDGFNVTMAGWSLRDIHIPVGLRFPLSPDTIGGEIVRTGGPVRKDSWEDAQSDLARLVRERGVRSSVGAPVIVEGRLWGALVAATDREDGLPGGTETQLARFTDLVATAISNTESRDGLRNLAEEQAALLRVAGLVAREAPPAELWAAVCAEVAQVFDLPWVELARYDGDDSATVIGAAGHHPFSVGTRWPLDGPSIMQLVRSSGRPCRIDDYGELAGTIAEVARAGGIRGAIGAPVVVDGVTWGAFVAIATDEQGTEIPAGAEERLGVFTELIAAAISNVEAHDDLRNLANEQGALRRVATLVAQGAGRDELFAAVATEAAHLLHVSGAVLDRFEPDRTAITLAASYEASWMEAQGVLEVGARWPPDEGSLAAMLVGTGRAARVDDPADTGGGIAERWHAAGIGSAVAAPIVVGGKLWGAIRVFARRGARLPGDTEQRLAAFTELVATSVSNASARDELIASRARIVAAGDDARRRIERDLHDGTQQRLIALGLDLQRIRATVVEDPAEAAAGLSHMEDDLQLLLEEIRELSSNLHPPLLSRRGFVPALRALARRSPIPVEIDVELRERPPAAIETALYYVASEALTNAIKHSQASAISVSVETDHVGWPFGIGLDGRRGVGQLYATISDDGVGGADVTTGSGLSGLADRIDALGGRFSIDSPAGLGTRISIVLPLDH